MNNCSKCGGLLISDNTVGAVYCINCGRESYPGHTPPPPVHPHKKDREGYRLKR